MLCFIIQLYREGWRRLPSAESERLDMRARDWMLFLQICILLEKVMCECVSVLVCYYVSVLECQCSMLVCKRCTDCKNDGFWFASDL